MSADMPYHDADEANLACERLEGVIDSEGLDASVDVSSDGWVVVRLAPEAADRLDLRDDDAFVLSEDERRSVVLTLEEISRRGYDLSDTQVALRARLNESLLRGAMATAFASVDTCGDCGRSISREHADDGSCPLG